MPEPPLPFRETRPIRILIVDDQPIGRQGQRMAFALEADLAVVGEAGGGRVALARAAELHPDVVLLDVAMPLLDGIAVAAALRKVAPESRVVILTLYDDPLTRARAIEAGAVEFVGKHQGEGILTAIVRRAATGARPGIMR